jgi:hypothetical protein
MIWIKTPLPNRIFGLHKSTTPEMGEAFTQHELLAERSSADRALHYSIA